MRRTTRTKDGKETEEVGQQIRVHEYGIKETGHEYRSTKGLTKNSGLPTSRVVTTKNSD